MLPWLMVNIRKCQLVNSLLISDIQRLVSYWVNSTMQPDNLGHWLNAELQNAESKMRNRKLWKFMRNGGCGMRKL